MGNPYQPDLRPFLGYVERELDYLAPFDLTGDPELMKAAGALVVLQEYLERLIGEQHEDLRQHEGEGGDPRDR